MGDLAYDYRLETEWLQLYLETHGGAVFFPTVVGSEMRREGISGLDVLFVIKTGGVVWGEPDPSGAHWLVEGEDADGRLMRITLKVDVNVMRVEVIGVATA